MRVVEGAEVRARIYLGERDTWHGRPLYRALVERLRAAGYAGATVLRAIEGFGATSVIHAASLVDLSADLPIVIEVVDTKARIDALVPILDEMMQGGLATFEDVEVLRYAAGRRMRG